MLFNQTYAENLRFLGKPFKEIADFPHIDYKNLNKSVK
jgi:hypothetical protein